MTKPGLLTREARLVLVYVFLNSVPLGYMSVVPLVYLIQRGFSPVTIGVIYAASGVANTIGYTPFGVLADRYGRKKFLILGSVLPALAYCIFGLTFDPYLLIVAGIFGGVGLAGGLAISMSSTSILPVLADSSPNGDRTTLFGVYEGVATVGLSMGSFSAVVPSVISSGFSQGTVVAHSESYFIMSALMIGSIIPLLLIRERRGKQILVGGDSLTKRAPSTRRWGAVTSWPKIARFSLIFGLSGLGYGVLVQLLPTWYNLKFGVTEGTVGLWMGAAQLLSVAVIPMIPLVVRRQGIVNVGVRAGVAASIPLFLMPFAGTFEVAAALFVLRNMFLTLNAPAFQSYIAGSVSKRERATTFGIVFTAWGVANSVGTVVAGGLLGANLLALPFAIGASAYLAFSLVFFIFFRGTRVPEEGSIEQVELAS